MDQNAVYQLFVATYHPDPSVHKQAELNIRNIESKPGFLPLVLQIQASHELELGARQAAAIYFKNRVRRVWDTLNEGDKKVIKEHILSAFINALAPVQVQLTASLFTILSNDFPQQWPSFMQELERYLISDDVRLVYVGLLALREVVKVYEWKSLDKRDPLLYIIKHTFHPILIICNKLLMSDTQEAGEMLKLALKTYYASIQFELPKSLQESIEPWGTLFLQLINRPVTESSGIWIKTKKWAYHCLNRLFGKYGQTRSTAFARSFLTQFAPNILTLYLQQIDGWIKKEIWISPRCLDLTAEFFVDCVKQKVTWQIMKPHCEILVSQFIYPQLCFSDEQLWMEDPVDYVHKKIDEDPIQNSVVELLVTLAGYRKKHTFLGILGFIHSVLNTYLATPEDMKRGGEKDGALCMIGALAHLIVGNKSQVEKNMEAFFVAHVIPEFKSRFPYLRARACDITRHFSEFEFADAENLFTVYQGVSGCLADTELPVRVQAALALQPMIHHDLVYQAIQPNVPMIMQELLNLTNEIDVDTLAQVMETFVEVFSEQLTPFAVQLCVQLRDTFLRIMEELSQMSHASEEEDEMSPEQSEKTMAAMGVLKTVGTLILSLENSPDILLELEKVLIPVIEYTLEKKMADLYDDVFEIIDSCTFSSKQVSPTMWSVFELIYKVFMDTGIHYMEEMLPVLSNYICYGNEMFHTNQHVKQMMYGIIDIAMKKDDVAEGERVCACKLMESMLLRCKGCIDHFVPSFLQLSFQYIFTGQMKTLEFKVHCVEVVISCIYYNPLLTLRYLEDNQWTQGFFTLWFSLLDKLSRVHDKKLSIFVMCLLLELPPDQIPLSLQSGWTQVLTSILHIFKGLPKAMENLLELESEYGGIFDIEDEEEDGEAEEEEEEEEDEDEDILSEDAEYLNYLDEESRKGEGEAQEEELVEDILYESPLDALDPYLRFQQVIQALQQHQPQLYHHLVKDISEEDQIWLVELVAMDTKLKETID
ncbi:armadillo-type protein [Pilobolus umbonatus]|nr:armadillo-type protein [Pilobolus umbonatus]